MLKNRLDRFLHNRVIFFSLICLLVFMLSGCQDVSNKLLSDIYDNPDEVTESAGDASSSDQAGEDSQENNQDDSQIANQDIYGELTLYDWNTSYSIFQQGLISDFNKLYPNIQINVIGPEAGDTDLPSTILTALMSDKAGDIIDLGPIPYYQYATSGMLEDLNSYMANDPSFQRDDYYTNIFKAFEMDNKLYGIPMSFRYWCYRFNKTLLEENSIDISAVNSVNYQDITDIFHRISTSNPEVILSKYWERQLLDMNELGCYFDEKNNTATFNSPEFIEYLKESNSIPWPVINFYSVEMANIGQDCLSTIEENEIISFSSSDYVRPENALVYISPPANATAPIPAAASNGEKEFRVMSPILAIPSSSMNKELAWLFISYCIKEKSLDELTGYYINDGYPINRKNTLKLLEQAFGPGHDEAIAKIDEWNQERDSMVLSVNQDLSLDLQNIMKEYFDGGITAEECAAKAQECVDLYRSEQ